MGSNKQLFQDIIRAISLVIEFDEHSKNNHTRRVAVLAYHLADTLGLNKKGLLFFAGLIHDIGGMSLPNWSLNQPLLSDGEGSVAHVQKGVEILKPFSLLHPLLPIIADHHERYDGHGFPVGKGGEDINIECYVLQLADQLEDLIDTTGNYATESALRLLHENRGRSFHPLVVDATVTLLTKKPNLIEQLYTEEGLNILVDEVDADPPYLGGFDKDQILGQLLLLFAGIIDAKHEQVLGHSIRVSFYASQIVDALGCAQINSHEALWAGLLHDVGIVRVPASILAKAQSLNEEERLWVQGHAKATADIIGSIGEIAHLAPAAAAHHEHYDGSGYPTGIAEEEIPLLGRVLAYSEMYDTLTHGGPFHKRLTSEQAIEQMRPKTGSVLDPHIAVTSFDVLAFFGRHPLHFEESIMAFRKMVREEVSNVDRILGLQRKFALSDQSSKMNRLSLGEEPWQHIKVVCPGGKIRKGRKLFRKMVGIRNRFALGDFLGPESKQDIRYLLTTMKVGETRTEQATTLAGDALELLVLKKKKTARVFYRKVANPIQSIDRLALFYRNFLKSSESIVITDPDGKIVDANMRFLDLHGLRRENVIGQKPHIVKSGDHRPGFFRTMWETITDPAKGCWSGEVVNRGRVAGEKVTLYLTIHSVRDSSGRIIGFIGHGVDMSAQKRVSEALRQKERALEESNRSLKRLNDFKSDLMAITSHDLKVPLNAMIQAAHLARESLGQESKSVGSPDHTLTWIDSIVEKGNQMASFIRDILDVERLDSGTLRLKKRAVQLSDLLRECVGTMQPLAAPRVKLVLSVEVENGPVIIDPIRMRQVFDNLLSNAIKFSPPGGTVTVCCRDQGEGVVEVSVADQGPGIPAAEMATIFDRYVQARTRVGGTGLGLFIVRQILQLHGGNVAVCNRNSGNGGRSGAIFTITIPTVTALKDTHFSVLIVGCKKELAPYLLRPLKQRSARVFWAESVAPARRFYRTLKPQIVFSQDGAFLNELRDIAQQGEKNVGSQPALVLLGQSTTHTVGHENDPCLTLPILESEVFQILETHTRKSTSNNLANARDCS